ncbi:hypothetical protein FGO68_gene8940 [Halteria grandinella]|uniref:Uncharacterized protein n=1 Tax=Halteria grandinella TaxID=5974 RepID=A0A8J8P4Y4_HALGN|nr:hypothetical protein FGO68_gene8940 [Halteria grandinella]
MDNRREISLINESVQEPSSIIDESIHMFKRQLNDSADDQLSLVKFTDGEPSLRAFKLNGRSRQEAYRSIYQDFVNKSSSNCSTKSQQKMLHHIPFQSYENAVNQESDDGEVEEPVQQRIGPTMIERNKDLAEVASGYSDYKDEKQVAKSPLQGGGSFRQINASMNQFLRCSTSQGGNYQLNNAQLFKPLKPKLLEMSTIQSSSQQHSHNNSAILDPSNTSQGNVLEASQNNFHESTSTKEPCNMIMLSKRNVERYQKFLLKIKNARTHLVNQSQQHKNHITLKPLITQLKSSTRNDQSQEKDQQPMLHVLGIEHAVLKQPPTKRYQELDSARNTVIAGGVRQWQQRVRQQQAQTGLSMAVNKKVLPQTQSQKALVSEWQFSYNQDLQAVSTNPHKQYQKSQHSASQLSARQTGGFGGKLTHRAQTSTPPNMQIVVGHTMHKWDSTPALPKLNKQEPKKQQAVPSIRLHSLHTSEPGNRRYKIVL